MTVPDYNNDFYDIPGAKEPNIEEAIAIMLRKTNQHGATMRGIMTTDSVPELRQLMHDPRRSPTDPKCRQHRGLVRGNCRGLDGRAKHTEFHKQTTK